MVFQDPRSSLNRSLTTEETLARALKACAVCITRQIAVDYAEDNIICNAVAPGRILTGKPMNDEGMDPIEYSRMRTPMPRLGRPGDVAHASLFLASDEATYITGHNLMVDGGWMAF